MGIIRVVRGGGAALIFPEGSRSPSGELQASQPGVGFIAAKTGAPVVPVWIDGSFAALPRGTYCPAKKAVTVIEEAIFVVNTAYESWSDVGWWAELNGLPMITVTAFFAGQ